MVKTINLMDLRRSTLKDGSVSGDACLTVTSVINDLNDLQWQECHVTSLISQGVAATSTSATKDRTIPVNRKKSKGLGKKPVKVEADDYIFSITGTTDVDSSTTVVKLKNLEDLGKKPVEVAADDSIIPTTSTTASAAGSSTVSVKGKKSKGLGKKSVEVAADDSIIPPTSTNVAAGSTTVSEKGKKSKGLGKKPVEVAADDFIISTSSTTVSLKRKISKGLEMKPVKDAADDSTISTKCTNVAEGGTTVSAKSKRLRGLGFTDLGMKPVVGARAAEHSISTTGTPHAAESTT